MRTRSKEQQTSMPGRAVGVRIEQLGTRRHRAAKLKLWGIAWAAPSSICAQAAFWCEDQFTWLFRNPVFPVQILLMLLASWGLLGADLGVERLFWSEIWAVQLGCGLAVGMLFGVVLFVWYLLDRPRRAVYVASRSGRPSLFPVGPTFACGDSARTCSGRCRSSWL